MLNYNLKHCVYITTHPILGKFYIGKGITKRVITGDYKGSGRILRDYFKKYNKREWNSTIIYTCDDEKTAYRLEEILVSDELLLDENCLNACVGGKGGTNWTSNFDRGLKISLAMKGRTRGKQDAETIKKRIQTFNDPEIKKRLGHAKGKKIILSEEMKKEHSDRMKRTMEKFRNTSEQIELRNIRIKNKIIRDEHIKNTREDRKIRHYASVSRKLTGAGNGTAVCVKVNDITFGCVKDALEYFGEKYLYKLLQKYSMESEEAYYSLQGLKVVKLIKRNMNQCS